MLVGHNNQTMLISGKNNQRWCQEGMSARLIGPTSYGLRFVLKGKLIISKKFEQKKSCCFVVLFEVFVFLLHNILIFDVSDQDELFSEFVR